MKTTTFYGQTFSQLDKSPTFRSREIVLEDYFRKYLPSLFVRAGFAIKSFIQGNITYTDMLDIIAGLQEERTKQQIPRRQRFDTKEQETYGPRSMAPYPDSMIADPLRQEVQLFIQAFGPKNFSDTSTVRGTRQSIQNQVQSIGAW